MRKMLWTVPAILLGLQVTAFSQDVVPRGTEIVIRTDESIHVKKSDRGRIYRGEVARDLIGRDGRVAIRRGAPAELTIRQISRDDMIIDVDSISVDGRRYILDTSGEPTYDTGRSGVGGNNRTAKYVGGGAILGTIIGAIAGGGKGAAIGAAAGAAGGASAQILTKGREIRVPAESILTFRLDRPIRLVDDRDNGRDRNGHHYHDYR